MDFRRVYAFHGISSLAVCDISITEHFDVALLFTIRCLTESFLFWWTASIPNQDVQHACEPSKMIKGSNRNCCITGCSTLGRWELLTHTMTTFHQAGSLYWYCHSQSQFTSRHTCNSVGSGWHNWEQMFARAQGEVKAQQARCHSVPIIINCLGWGKQG